MENFMNWLEEQPDRPFELYKLVEWWILYKQQQINAEQLNKPCVSNNEMAVCDHSGVNVMPRTKWEQTKR
jgi:hypothetical protein